MNDKIDSFRENIRKKLRKTKNGISDKIVVNHSKFNEDLEFYIEETDLDQHVNDLIIQIGNYGYVRGIEVGLRASDSKIKEVEEMAIKVRNSVNMEQKIEYGINSLVAAIFFGSIFIALAIVFS